jgi:hypothetical protein
MSGVKPQKGLLEMSDARDMGRGLWALTLPIFDTPPGAGLLLVAFRHNFLEIIVFLSGYIEGLARSVCCQGRANGASTVHQCTEPTSTIPNRLS